LDDLLNVSGGEFSLGAPAFLAFAYFFLVWDSRRADSPNKDDGQIGLKLVLYFFIIIGIGFAAGGIATLLGYLLSGAKVGTSVLKQGLAGILSGVVPIFAVAVVLLPRTNYLQYTRAARLSYGYLAAVGGFVALQSLQRVVSLLIMSDPWASTSGQIAHLLVFGGVAGFALSRLGSLSSWSAPVRPAPMAPSQGYPPQGGGYPPQGYPPQGYPQSYGGGYGPPQGGGYPPGGGYQPR
jgi:hypothetical protein